MSEDQTRLDLWLTSAAPQLVSVAESLAGPDRVQVHSAQYSYSTLQALKGRIADDMLELNHLGVVIGTVGPDETTNSVRVGVVDLNADKELLLRGRYGPDITIVPGHLVGPVGRFNDYQPWYGGGQLTDKLGHGCTGGIPLRRPSGAKYLVTAGHCFPLSTTVYNSNDQTNQVGTVSESASYLNLDVELLPSDAAGFSFRTNDTTGQSAGARNASRNSSLCKSGITTNEVCGMRITQLDVSTQTTTGGRFDHVDFAYANTKTVAPGDSGGPVYSLNSNGTITYAGTTSGAVQPYSYCEGCSKEVAFTEWSYIASQFGVSVL